MSSCAGLLFLLCSYIFCCVANAARTSSEASLCPVDEKSDDSENDEEDEDNDKDDKIALHYGIYVVLSWGFAESLYGGPECGSPRASGVGQVCTLVV